MKKLLISVLLLFVFNISFSQNETLFAEKEMTWFGIDYSHVKLVGGSIEFSNTMQIRDYYFNLINDLILNESSKYPIDKWFKKDNIYTDLSFVKKNNLTPEIENLMVDATQELNYDSIRSIVNRIDTKNTKTVLGGMIVMENMIKAVNNYNPNVYTSSNNSNKGYATMWVVLFNTRNKNIIACNQIEGNVSGIGFRNNWANSIHSAMAEYNYDDLSKDNIDLSSDKNDLIHNNRDTITNDKIIELTNKGFSPSFIISKIRHNIKIFDLSSKAIKRLNRQLVAVEVITEMKSSVEFKK